MRRATAFVRACIVSIAACLLLAAGASAAAITVNVGTDNGGTGCELREAITSANADDAAGNGCDSGNNTDDITIDIPGGPPDTITLVGDAPVITGNTTITGAGPTQTIIDGDGAGGTQHHRILTIFGSVATITGVTLQDGGGQVEATGFVQGGALYVNGGLTLNDVVIRNNFAVAVNASGTQAFADGAGILKVSGSPMTINNSVIEQNYAHATQSDLASGGSAFARGAGVFSDSGDLTITDSTIDNNKAEADRGPGPASQATAIGGGVVSNGRLFMTGSTVSNNTTDAASADADVIVEAKSGGIQSASFYTGFNASVLNLSTIAHNRTSTTCTGCASVQEGGAGVLVTNSNRLDVTSTTFGDNGTSSVPSPDGQSVLSQGGNGVSLRNTIIADPFGGGKNCAGTGFIDFGSNIDYTPTAGAEGSCPGASTADPLIGQIADNGGPTKTFAIPENSPAVDKGLVVGESTDQRGAGFTRPVDFPAIAPVSGGNDTDIGSFELQRRTLTVNRSGSGSGGVQASGIACGGATPDCDEQFAEGQVVTLTATEDPGSQPVVWSGCDSVNGSNECVVTLSSNKTVTATFNVQPAAPGNGGGGTTTPGAATPGPTGQRAAALAKCKKKKGKKRKKCKKKAAALPV